MLAGDIDFDKVLKSIASMIERSEKAFGKFLPGTSQHTLLKNRVNALKTASLLIKAEMPKNIEPVFLEKDDMEKALAPIESLISKSEKAREKVAQGSWQYKMLTDNLDALYMALPVLNKALGNIE